MIVLSLSMLVEDVFELTNGMCHVFTCKYEEEDILQHANGKCQLCTF